MSKNFKRLLFYFLVAMGIAAMPLLAHRDPGDGPGHVLCHHDIGRSPGPGRRPIVRVRRDSLRGAAPDRPAMEATAAPGILGHSTFRDGHAGAEQLPEHEYRVARGK